MGARRLVLLVCIVVALAVPGSASAHANLLRTSPQDGAALATGPRQARFVFDDTVRVASGVKAVRNGGGSVLDGKPRVVAGRTLVVPLEPLTRGDYTVLWRVISDDGHTEAGVIVFSVGTGAPPGVAALTASAGPSAREVVGRWLFFAGLLVAAGGALFRLAVGPARSGILLPAFVACFLGASGLLPHQGGAFATRFAGAYAIAALLAAFGATAAAVAFVDARARPFAWAAALLMLPLPSIAGHSLDAGQSALELPVDMLHLAAAAVWTGGLVQLALALRDGDRATRMGLVRRFSTVALVAVLVLGATGVVRALSELSAVSQLWTTGYGRLLIVKTGLLAVLVGIGWVNRYRLVPANDTGRLAWTVRGELVLLCGLVVAVAILTDVRPGRGAAAAVVQHVVGPPPRPPGDAVVFAQEDGDNAVALAVQPTRMQVTVLGQTGLGVNDLRVTVAGTPALPCGAGCYAATTDARGRVPVTVEGRRLFFVVPRRAPSAAGTVAAATSAFKSLRSVTYVERLASSPQNRIVSTFTLEAPDRIHYGIHGGSSATIIGGRRWDGCRTSQVTSLPQPSPIWGGPVTNAHLLARTRTRELVSFLVPRLPAWFTVDLDRRNLRPSSLEMTATAHFMHHTYTSFDAPRRIFPPRCG